MKSTNVDDQTWPPGRRADDRALAAADPVFRGSALTRFSIEHASDAIFWVTCDGAIKYVNQTACDVLGYSRDELTSMTSREIDPVFARGELPNADWALLRRIGHGRFETEHRARDGRLIPVEVRTNYVVFDGVEYNCCFATDLTERRRVEEAMRFAQFSVEHVADCVYWVTEDGRIFYANVAACRALGYSRAELRDLSVPDLDATFRVEDWLLHWADLKRLGSMTLESVHVARDGRHIPVEISANYMTCGDRAFNCAIVRDIGERKRAEAALKAAKAEAERANKAKSSFLAATSHDLRQPLAALALYVGMLEHKLGSDFDLLLGSMKDCVDSLSELLTDQLDLSKLDAGVVVPTVGDFAVDEVINRVLAAHVPAADLKRLALRYRPCGRSACTDPVLFGRIVGNLVSNAIRYTERGGVFVGCRRREGALWIEVWDTGIGIREDMLGEIFDEFRQLGSGSVRGSGLGLAIVSRMATLLGLGIRVRSRPGRGSMFAVELPSGKTRASLVQPATRDEPMRIAIVEDHPHVVRALAASLEAIGHEVVAAACGHELLQRLGGAPPQLLISDYRLAGEATGFDVIEAVRAAHGGDLPVILITGDTDPALIRDLVGRGIAVQHKPIDFDALRKCIGAVTHPASGRAGADQLIDRPIGSIGVGP